MSETRVPIILLEDDPVQRGLIAEGLMEAGYAVTEAATGQIAQEALAATGGRAILVADRSLDDGRPTGFQLAADALEQFPYLRVIYMSGTHIAVRRRTLGERERALLKPFAMAQLMGAVRELGG